MSENPDEQPGTAPSGTAKAVVGLGIAGPAKRPGAKKAAPAAEPPKAEAEPERAEADPPVEPSKDNAVEPEQAEIAEPVSSEPKPAATEASAAAKPTVGLGIAGPAKRPGAKKAAPAAEPPKEAPKPAQEPKPEPVKAEAKPEPPKEAPKPAQEPKPEPVKAEAKPEPEPVKAKPVKAKPVKALKVPSGTVKSVRSFIAAHGGSGDVVLQNIGQAGVRITLIGKDGILGDEVVRDLPTAKAVVAAVDGLEESEWTRELVSTATPAPGHARKMAGWVANT